MSKSIEEQREELAEKYVSLSAPEMTRLQMSWDFKNGFDSGAKARDEQWLKVVNELREALSASTEVLHNAYYEIDDDTDEYKERCIKNREATIKADQMMKEMGVEK